MRGGRCLRPPRCAQPLPPPTPQRLALVALPQRPGGGAHPSGCPAGRLQPLSTSADPCVLGDPEKLCPLRTQVGKLHPGLRGDKRDGSPAISLYLELWPGNAGSPGQALSPRPAEGYTPASVARSERGSRSPAAHAPPLCWSHRGAESPLPRSPAAPTAGAAPAPPGSRLPTSGLPGSPPPPHHMAAPATGSRRKPEAAMTPPPPPSLRGAAAVRLGFPPAAGAERDLPGQGRVAP